MTPDEIRAALLAEFGPEDKADGIIYCIRFVEPAGEHEFCGAWHVPRSALQRLVEGAVDKGLRVGVDEMPDLLVNLPQKFRKTLPNGEPACCTLAYPSAPIELGEQVRSTRD